MPKSLIFSVLSILLILAFLPKIASTHIGKQLFVKVLEKKIQGSVEIGSLHLSWLGPQQFQDLKWRRDAVNGSIENLSIQAPFWSFKGPFELTNGTVFYKEGKIEQIQGKIEGNDFALQGITLQGYLSVQGKVFSKDLFDVQIDVKQFPLLAIDPLLDRLLGSSLNLNGTVKMDGGIGVIDLAIQTPHLETRLNGGLTNHSITLQKALLAVIRLTPELSALLLKDVNPLFLTGLQAENPITLRIEPTDFYFPLPYSLETLSIGKATLDLGKVKCQNGHSLSEIIALLKDFRFSTASQMNAWFTPFTFELKQGILKAERMDALLADSIHVCTWGKINLVQDQIDMFLGLPADTLQTSFGIKNLPENYVLKVPLRGTTKNPDLVKGPAIAKIAALIAAGQVPNQGILGGIANLISRPKEEKDVPPAKRPFPWE